jgi:hypothetical protein
MVPDAVRLSFSGAGIKLLDVKRGPFSESFLPKGIGSLDLTGMREVTGPMEWRIDDPGRKIWLTVDTAICLPDADAQTRPADQSPGEMKSISVRSRVG